MIRLSREVEVKTFVVSGTVAVGEKRPEFLAVARLAQDFGGTVDYKKIRRELFDNMPEQVGKLVVERCVAMGLLEGDWKHAKLSDNGRLALEKGEVLVPQEGEWRIWHATDPLLDEPILHVQRMAEGQNRGKKLRNQGGEVKPCPKTLDKHRCITSASDGRIYKLEQLAKEGQNGPSEKVTIEIIWEAGEDKPIVRLFGNINQKKLDHSLSDLPQRLAEWTPDKLWRQLVLGSDRGRNLSENELEAWAVRAQENILPVTFGDTFSMERATFSTRVTIIAPKLPEIGPFNSTSLEKVKLVPFSDECAKEWASWLQLEGLNDYQTPATLDINNQKIFKKFPFHNVCLPDRDELLDNARRNIFEPKSRFVLAPYDLGLWR